MKARRGHRTRNSLVFSPPILSHFPDSTDFSLGRHTLFNSETEKAKHSCNSRLGQRSSLSALEQTSDSRNKKNKRPGLVELPETRKDHDLDLDVDPGSPTDSDLVRVRYLECASVSFAQFSKGRSAPWKIV